MTHDISIAKSTIKIVRDAIDRIYDMTKTEDGFDGSLHKAGNGSRFSSVATILLKRGILVKTGTAVAPNYKWNTMCMSPTKTLYKSVATDMVLKERERTNRYYQKVKERERAEQPPVVEQKPVTLADFTIQELWDELKSRGCYAVDGRLALGVVTYFD